MATAQLTAVVDTKGVTKAKNDLDKFSKSANDAEKGLDKTEDAVKGLGDSAKKTTVNIKALGSALTRSVKPIAATVAVAGGAFALYASAVSDANRETEVLARQSGLAIDDFKALAFAASTVGVNADQLSGQLEDARRNLAEFAKVGTGPFQDYADIMGITTDEAQKLALQLGKLSGRDAVLKLTENMENANVPIEQMGFVLDSLGSDMDRLIPILSNGGNAAAELETKFKSLATTIREEDIKAYEELSQNVNLATTSFGVLIAEGLSPLANAFSVAAEEGAKFFKSLIDDSRAAKEQIQADLAVDELLASQTFGTGRGKQTRAGVAEAKEVNDLLLRNKELQELIGAEFVKATGNAARNNDKRREAFIESQEAAKIEIEENRIKIEQLAEQSKLAQQIVDIRTKSITDAPSAVEAQNVEQTEILASKQTHEEALTEIEAKGYSDRLKLSKDAAKKEADIEAQKVKDREDATAQVISSITSSLDEGTALYKAAAITETIINTEKGAIAALSAFASLGPVGVPLGIAAAGVITAAGGAAVANIAAREQGGQISAGESVLVGERGPEVITAGSSGRVRTANQIKNDMGGGSTQVSLVVIDQSSGNKEFTQEEQDDGRIVLLIRNTVAADTANPNSDISKSISNFTTAERRR